MSMKSIRESLTNLILRKNILLRSRAEHIIFFSSFFVTGVFIILYIVSGNAAHPLMQISSDSYMPQAISLYERGAFTNSTTTPYLPEATNVPGYPLFLAITAVPWNNVIPTLLLQALLFAFTSVLLYRLFAGVFSERVRFIATLVFALEPFTAFIVAQALSETLFLLLLISGLYVGRRAVEQAAPKLFFLSVLLLSAATLTRPILLYALPIMLIAALIFVYRISHKRVLAMLVAGAFGMLVVLAPWAYRNYESSGVWLLSTKGAYTLYFYDVSLLLQYRDGLSGIEANQQLFERAKTVYPDIRTAEDLREPKYASYLTKESVVIIRTAPIEFTKMYIASLGTFFLSDGYRLLWREFSNGAIVLPNITQAIVTGHLEILWTYLQEQPIQALLFVVGLTFWGLAFLLSGVAVVSELVRPSPRRLAIFACAAIILYFAILTGPVAQARYRIVVTPFLFMLAAYGASVLLSALRRRVKHHVL